MKLIHHFSPLPPSVTVSRSKIHGLGLIALDDIEAGVDLGISHVLNDNYKDGLIRTPLGGFINHSANANCLLENDGKNLKLVTQKQIDKDEELTVDYHGWYDDDAISKLK